jgi:hypothetical protein
VRSAAIDGVRPLRPPKSQWRRSEVQAVYTRVCVTTANDLPELVDAVDTIKKSDFLLENWNSVTMSETLCDPCHLQKSRSEAGTNLNALP